MHAVDVYLYAVRSRGGTAMSLFRLYPARLHHWSECAGVFLREDAVRVSLHIELWNEEVPVDEEGDPVGHVPCWLVQFPRMSVEPGRVCYQTTTLPATLSIEEVLARVDTTWPMGPRPE